MYDIIIVGAGPAGANAALECARLGIKTLILEKEVFPRNKPCGGAMPASVQELISLDITPVIKNRVKFFETYNNYEDRVLSQFSDQSDIILVQRSEFDMFLLEGVKKVEGNQVEIRESSTVVSLDEQEDKVNVKLKSGEVLKTKYVIASDGAMGKIASTIHQLIKKRFASALDAEVITVDAYYKANKHKVLLNYFCLPQGYGWIFPKDQNRFSCGMGTWGKPINFKNQLNDFLKQSFHNGVMQSIKITGYPIPIYQGSQQLASHRILLTGDAASLVDPVSGEGIRFALESGKIAANVIGYALLDNTDQTSPSMVSTLYQKHIDEQIGKELKHTLSFASLAFINSPSLYYKKFIKVKK